MKLHFIKSPLALILALSITMVSCLKDKDYDNGVIQSVHGTETNVIGVVLNAANNNGFYGAAYDNSNNDTTVNLIPITLATNAPAPQDIHVTMVADNTLITAYNTANGTNLTPTSAYTVVNGGVVVIPKGSYTGYLQIKFKPSTFLGLSPAVAFKITSIAEPGYVISGNAYTGIVAINIKNRYDGHYVVTGSLVDLTAPTITGYYPFEMDFITVGANTNDLSVTIPTGAAGANHPITSGGALSRYGTYAPEFTIDPVTNKVTTVVNTFGQPAPNGRSAAIDPSGINTYDPVTKTIKVSYFLLQPGTAVRTQFTEVFTYLHAR